MRTIIGNGGLAAVSFINGEVLNYAALPAAASHSGEFYLVQEASGLYLINRKPKGLYYSNGTTWSPAPDIVPFFNAGNFEIYDNADNTKKIKFDATGITTGNSRTLTVPDVSGTLALLEAANVFTANQGIGITPTALIHLKAGTAVAGTAPIKLTSGVLLATPEAGTIEYDGCSTYVTNIATQRAIDRTSDVAVSTVTVANTTTETTIWTAAMPANSLCAGNLLKFHCDGIIQNDGSAATEEVTLRIKVGGNTVATLNPTTKAIAADSHWHIDANATQRTIGATGSRAVHIDLDIDGTTEEIIAVATVNTTINMDVTVTAEWASADVNNTISLYQGFMEYKN